MSFAIRLLPLFVAAAAAIGAVSAQKTPDEALRALQDGNQRFCAERSIAQPLGEGVRRTLARGQSPFAIVLCCADSRVPPEHVFNAGLGELFVVRVAGHCADPETVASIEYAVEHLGASLCVVLGHEKCGAVAATVQQVDQPGHESEHSSALQQLLEHIEPAVRKAKARDLGGKTLHDVCEEEHAHATVQDCFRRSALLRRYASVGKFRMVAARYHLQSGEVEWLPNRPLPNDETTAAPPHIEPPAGVPPHVALRMLQAGHRRFLSDKKPTADLTAARRETLSHGQQPMAIVVTCADSRVAPEHVFDCGLGEIFVIRIAGNSINDDALASIEYAAGHLGASLLVVMGHSKCGAVLAATQKPEGHELSPNLRALLLRLEPSVAAARAEAKGRDLVDLAVRGNALRAVSEARSRSAVLRQLEGEGRFAMLSCVYDITSGDLEWLKDAAEPTAKAAAASPPASKDAAPPGAAADPHAKAAPKQAPAAANHELPVLEWANAAPGGESKSAAAHVEQPAPNAHGDPAVHAEAHGEHSTTAEPAAHDEHASAEPAAPAAEPGHGGAEAPHGEAAHGEAPDRQHDDAAHADHVQDAHPAEHGHASATTSVTPAPWRDPIVLVGISGVISLLAAAMLAMKRR